MRIFLLLLMLVCGGLAVAYVYQNEILPVRQVQIDGSLDHVNLAEVEKALLPYVQHGLLGIDVTALQNSLITLPWIAQARVSRMWPDTVHVWLAEPQAVALWANNGIVSEEGRVYYLPPGETLPNLPVFEGLEGQSQLMLSHYQDMQLILQPLDLQVQRLILTPRQSWEVQLNNGIRVRLGQQDTLPRLERFVSAYPHLTADPTQPIDYVDLRYPNGLAVKVREKQI